mgnify:CR=1 FL=1
MDYADIKVETIYPRSTVALGRSPCGWEACGWITYSESSVLAGQSQEIPVSWFDTLERAKEKYPNADISEHPRSGQRPSVSACPPPWFDTADAGERWHEDDY